MTVLEVIQRGAAHLEKKGVDSPRLQSELLLAHALQIPRFQLYLQFDRVLTSSELECARALVRRRSQREPLQHILGSVSFCGLELAVNPSVLIPRPETELLAARAEQWLRDAWEKQADPLRVLDFGTGSGCLAIFLAVRRPEALVSALDISEAALEMARSNAARHGVQERIRFHRGDGFRGLAQGARYDLIVSNPPYIAGPEIEELAPEVRDHDPRLALDGGEDGLDFYRRFGQEAAEYLAPGGGLLCEFGDGQSEKIQALLSVAGWRVEFVDADYSGRPRILGARLK